MPTQRAEKVGWGSCVSCGKSTLYRKSKSGHLKVECDHCGLHGWIEPNEAAYVKAMATIQQEPAPGDPPAPPPAPAPAGFSLSKL